MEEEPLTCDVAVVGAGLSGLYAASILKKKGLDVRVLEGRERVAGRQYTKRDEQFGYVELGGAFVGQTQTKAIEVANDLGLELYEVRCDLKSTLILEGKRHRYTSGVPGFSNPFILADLNATLRELDRLSMQVPLVRPWEAENAEKWDSMSFQDFLDNYPWTRTTKALGKMACQAPFLVEPSDISFLYFLNEVRSSGGMVAITSTQNGLQGLKIKGGSGRISEELAHQLQGQVMFGRLVNKITQKDDFVHVQSENCTEIKAKRCVVAVPMPLLAKIKFEPQLSADLQLLSSVKTRGKGYKTFMFYNEQFWRNFGLNGELVSEDGIIGYALDDTKADGSFPCIMGFVYTKAAEEITKKSKEERQKLISQQYAKDFGLDQFLHPCWYEEKCWLDEDEEKYSGTCVWTLPPEILSKISSWPTEPEGNVFIGSTETSVTFRGYMDGALRSGHRCAAQVLQSLNIPYDYDSSEWCIDVPYVQRSALEKHLPSIKQCIWIAAVFVGAIVLPIGLGLFVPLT